MATREILKEDGGKSASSRPCPIPMAAVKTAAAIIASKTSAASMPSAPSLQNLWAPVSTSTSTTPSSQNQQHVVAKQSHELLPPLSAGAPRTLLSLQSILPAASMQQIPAIPKTKPKNNTISIATTVDYNQDTIQHLRSGKWTIEEELYANILIQLFEEGRIDEFEHAIGGDNNSNNNSNNSEEQTQQTPPFKITNGMTLRAYLSRKLFCSPMRISKKFAGKGIGKLVYTSQSPSSTYYHQRQRQAQIFPFSSSRPIISNTNIHAHSLPSASHWNKLKQAESNFLRVAFPHGGGPMNVNKRTSIHPLPLKVTSLFAASPSTSKRSLSSQLEFKGISSTKSSRPNKASRVGTSSHGPLQMQSPLTVSGKALSSRNQPNLGDTTNSTSPELPKAPFSCPSLSQTARNPTYTPLAPFPNNALQLQHNFNNASSPSAITSSPNSYESSLSQKQPSPLMAAPRLLSPNSKLRQMQGELKRQRMQERSQSQIQVLEEAYLNSVSSNKPQVSKSDKTNTTSVLAASPNLPAQLVHNAQPSTKIEGFDYNQMMGVSQKPGNDLPNFLTGFDKVSKHRSAPKNSTECDISAQFSPTYHTSKSFDDFHRYLGKGLSPTVSPPPQFPNFRTTNAGPGIPSIESSDVASTSNLQMRPRKQPNTASDKIISDATSSKSSASILEKRSDESLLIEAYAEAIKISHGCQQALQTTEAQGKFDVSTLDRFHNSFALSQQWANPSQGKDQELPTQQHKSDEPSLFDFPLEGMMFEDFETLAPFHGTSDMCGTVSDPSDGTSEGSDHTKLEESCTGMR